MKDLRYFLDAEDRYCQTNPEETMVWNDEAKDWDFKCIPLDFLRSRPFHESYNNLDYRKELTQGYNLSDAELTVLGMFIMHHSWCFRDDYYGEEIPEIAKEMFEVLDSLVAKAPKTTNHLLFRFCVDEDKHDMGVNDIVTFPHNLTCTIDNWIRSDNNKYVITPLSDSRTRAHDIYKMYPHNENERQVNFLRGTQFLVTDVQEISETKYHVFFMNELN